MIPAACRPSLGLPCPTIPLELPSYQKKENWGAAETFYQIVRALADPATAENRTPTTCNILGATALGFRHRDNLREIKRILGTLGIAVNVVAPMGSRPSDITRIPAAAFNVVLWPETAQSAARWLEKTFQQPYTKTVPIGANATRAFIEEVAELAGVDPAPALDDPDNRMPWWSRSVDSTYLTDKRVFVFGDATHAMAIARVCRDELGFKVVGLGTYSREFAREVRALAKEMDVEALITDDYLEVEEAITASAPELVLGTQMERHVAKRLGIGCAVISAPVHVQDYPARHSPVMGFEGANVLFDTLVHPLTMGLEEHLLAMFREDFEFSDEAGASHLAAHAPRPATTAASSENPSPGKAPALDATTPEPADDAPIVWDDAAMKELKKIPFFVRGRARNNTEKYAAENGLAAITVETLYDAKAHFGR